MSFKKRRDDFLSFGEMFEDVFDKSNFPFRVGKVEFPLINLYVTDNYYCIEVASPGSQKEDFKIKYEGNKIGISFEKPKDEGLVEEKDYKTQEFTFKKFSKFYTLPEDIDRENIVAKFDNGLLKVEVPKKEVEKEDDGVEIEIE